MKFLSLDADNMKINLDKKIDNLKSKNKFSLTDLSYKTRKLTLSSLTALLILFQKSGKEFVNILNMRFR